jgi:hypothetical protein
MVLAMRWLLLAALLVGGAGCIQRAPSQRLETSTPVAVAYVLDVDHGATVRDVPARLKEAVARELALRNLLAEEVDFEAIKGPFSQLRSTSRRFDYLRAHTEAPLVLLVETKPSFFSQLGGRYRWTVLARVTGQPRREGSTPASADLSEAVVLVFDHEREPHAVSQAAARIAERTGIVLDELLVDPGTRGQTLPVSAPSAGKGGRPDQQGPFRPGKGAIYFVMVDRFANGDRTNDEDADPSDPGAFHGGDLRGLLQRLDHLQALGVETVWLSPVFRMRTEKFFGHGAFHGYWVEDLTALEPRFGDEALLAELSDALRQRGMKLLLDMVLNHVGPDAALVTERPHWFHNKGALEKWDDEEQLVSHDVHGLPDLAYDHPEVYRHLLDASLKWIRLARPHGFRLDAVKHMSLDFWRRYNADIRAHAGEDFLLLGEMLDGDPSVLARTQREGAFSALFDFPLHFAVNDVFCREQSPLRLASVMTADRLYDDASTLVPLVDNHDLPRLMATCEGSLQKAQAALLFILTARGTPSFIWGTEEGMDGKDEPHNRASATFEDHPLRAFISRVMAARAAHPALHEGVPLLLEVGQDRLVYLRVTPTHASVHAVHRGKGPLTVQLPAALLGQSWQDVADGQQRPQQRLQVQPGQARVFVGRNSLDLRELHQRALAEWKGQGAPREVRLRVRGASVAEGETLLLTGSGTELGGWNPERAPAAGADAKIALTLPSGSAYEFKLVIRRRGGEHIWEEGPNRTLFVTPGDDPLVLELDFRTARPALAEAAP